MTIMSSVDPAKLSVSASNMVGAFNHARKSPSIPGIMLPQLFQDLDIVQSVLDTSTIYGLDEDTRAEIVDLMNMKSFKAVNDRVNHLTSPELYTRLKLSYPHVAKAYMNLKTAIGQLDQAVHPTQGRFEMAYPLANGPIVS